MAKRQSAQRLRGRTPKRPAHLVVTPDGDFAVSWPWIEPGWRIWILLPYLPLLAVAAFALAQTAPGGAAGPAWRTPLAVATLAAITLVTWAALAAAVNRATVTLANGWLSKVHRPLYWPGARKFRTADVEVVSVQEDRSSVEDGSDLVTYRLMVRVRGSFPRTLVQGLTEPSDAEYVRSRLTTAVGLGSDGGPP